MKSYKGKIIIISSPSGGGKSSICRRLLKKNKKDNWQFSVSYTTRPPRKNETDGVEYHFVTHARFQELKKKNEFAESCQVHRYYYGTSRKPLDKVLKKGGVMLLDVDVKGAGKLKEQFPLAATIFILPPSKLELKKRLKRRGTEDDKHLRIRRKRALSEMKLYKRFEYVVVNKDLKTAVDEVDMIIKSLHCRQRNLNLEQINRIVG
ncbi:MAG: guanylate kinase [Candidatus Zixiibacteriota bacterium]|nr:MAG: guanylate kinase [candidate division Zixibacteria bacterium]HHI03123.1 guanylate kinase [candidate division Zixibacteria bacterium]